MKVQHINLAISIGGRQVQAVAPVIISASRRTDIPAFHFPDLISCLERGYMSNRNPFNGTVQLISFSKTRLFVFWTKNPIPAINLLPYISAKGIGYYFQYTLNNYENENLEPGIPELKKRIETFKTLSTMIGKEKVIWRFDPLLLHDELSVSSLLSRIEQLGDELSGFTEKLVISFVDFSRYTKVKKRIMRHPLFKKGGIGEYEFTENQQHEMASGLSGLLKKWKRQNRAFEIATCAEAADLSEFGIQHNCCIDHRLIHRLFPGDKELMRFLDHTGKSDLDTNYPGLRDRGQRKFCGCILSKDIGSYNTCKSDCLYCYANR